MVIAHLRRDMGTPIRTADQADYGRMIQTIRARLGDQRVDAIWHQATTLPLEEVIGTVVAYGSPNASVRSDHVPEK